MSQQAVASAQRVQDRAFLARAFQLALKGRFTCSPNPMVGAVIVRDGVVIGEGFHQWAGQGHAEVNAIAAVGGDCVGATMYVTLEPCNHYGRTPPCVNAILNEGMARVVIATPDNNPDAAGGAQRLRDHGVDVEFIDGWDEINHGFIQRTQYQKPFVSLKLAASVDARTAMASGESQWITGAPARYQVQRLRAASCAIVTGVGSIIADDSQLTVRPNDWLAAYPAENVRQPLRVVVDSTLRMPVDAAIATAGTLVVHANHPDRDKAQLLQAQGCELLALDNGAGQIDLEALLGYLAEHKRCNYVMVEAGARLSGAFVKHELIDELHVFTAPVVMGSSARPLLQLDIGQMLDKLPIVRVDSRVVGDDLHEIYRFRKNSCKQVPNLLVNK